MTVQVFHFADPEIADKKGAARVLAAAHSDQDDAQSAKNRLPAGSTPVTVSFDRPSRNSERAAKIKALGLKGIYFRKSFSVFLTRNPYGAGPGYVGVDDTGLGGLSKNSSRSCMVCGAHVYGHGCAAAYWARPSAIPSQARILY